MPKFKFSKIIKWTKKNWLSLLFWIIIVFIILSFIFFWEDFWNYFRFDLKYSEKSEHIHSESLIAFHNVMITFLTILLVIVAAIQLGALNKTGKADFLFRLAQQYGSENIIKARQIIHTLYRKSKLKNKESTCECIHRNEISTAIDIMSRNLDSADDYILLLNLLDFLEDLAYYEESKKIEFEDIEDLMGPSIEFFYEIFEKRIQARREKYFNKEYYCNFEKLAKKCRKKREEKAAKCKNCECCRFKCCKCEGSECRSYSHCGCRVYTS